MLKAAVTFLVGIQLLLPPGMCLCQFVSVDHYPVVYLQHSATNLEPSTTATRVKCSCESCLHRVVSTGRAEDVAALEVSPPRPFAPQPEKHLPGCPAELGDMPTKITVPILALQFDQYESHFPLVWAIESERPHVRDYAQRTFTSHSPPLFISNCTLVI